MIGRRLSAAELQAVLDDPAVIEELLCGDPDDLQRCYRSAAAEGQAILLAL